MAVILVAVALPTVVTVTLAFWEAAIKPITFGLIEQVEYCGSPAQARLTVGMDPALSASATL